MKDVKITFTATDLSGKSVTDSYQAYLSDKNIKKEVQNFQKRGMDFTIVNSYTGEVVAKTVV